MKIFRNLSQILTLKKAYEKDGRNLLPEDLSIIENAAIAFDNQKILWVGRNNDLPSEFSQAAAEDLSGCVLTPEIVDAHTHLVFGGDRSHEYARRLNGEDYLKIAKEGGGILSTQKSTLAASREELFNSSIEKIERIHSYGVGTIEIKSGYALTFEGEKLLSEVIHDLKKHFVGKVQILNTFMAAHAIPKDFSSSDQYLETIVLPLLRELAPQKIIDAVDIFLEEGFFTAKDCKKLFKVARDLNIPTKLHGDEFIDLGGAKLAADEGCLSVEHLLGISDEGIKALSNSQTIANLLPGTGMFLGKAQAPARKMLDQGVKVAIASDYNPGSCHFDNLLLIASLSAPLLKMNQAEIWSAITLNAAHSLGLKNQGCLVNEMKPRFSIFTAPNIDYLTYNWGQNFSL